MSTKKEFFLRKGLKNVFVAKVIKDDLDEYITGPTFHLMPAGEMTRTVSSDMVNTWFDDTVFEAVGSEGATAIGLTGASLRAPKIAELLGKEVDSVTGAVIDDGEYHETYWAYGGEAEGKDGSSEKFWFGKGTFTPPEEADSTKDDTTNTNLMTLNYNAIPTKHIFNNGKKMKKIVISSTDSKVKEGQDWFSQVVTWDNLADVAERVTEITGITLSQSTATIVAGETKTITATLAPAEATGTIAWYTSNAAVATVEDGVITAQAEGTATITAVCGGLAATCVVTVTAE